MEKEQIKQQLNYENILAKEKLVTKSLLSDKDCFEISFNAKELVEQNIKSLSLTSEATTEVIINLVQHDLGQMHQSIAKEMLVKATKMAIESSQQIINEHSQSKPSNLTKADLPVLALSLASEIVEHHNKVNNNDHISHEAVNMSNNKHDEHQAMHQHEDRNQNDHSINMIKASFINRIDHEAHNFKQHQQHQQVIQKQMTQYHGMEI